MATQLIANAEKTVHTRRNKKNKALILFRKLTVHPQLGRDFGSQLRGSAGLT